MKNFKLKKAKYENSCWCCHVVIRKKEMYYANGKGCAVCDLCMTDWNKLGGALTDLPRSYASRNRVIASAPKEHPAPSSGV